MAGAPTPADSTASQRIARGLGCLAKGLGGLFLVAIGLILVMYVALVSQGGECLAEPAFHSTDGASSVLDAAHPVVERQSVLRMNAAALPTEPLTEATISVVLSPVVQQTPGADSPGSDSSASSPTVTLTLIRNDTGAIIAHTALPPAWQGDATDSAPIDCPLGQACERFYHVRLSAPGLPVGASIPVMWTVRTDVRYSAGASKCGPPDHAVVQFSSFPPDLVPSSLVAVAGPIGRDEPGGAVVARHVTVRSSAGGASAAVVPDAAFARLSIVEASQDNSAPSWRPWVRVIADDGDVPLADERLGRSSVRSGNSGTLEFPVLGGCPTGGSCTRGYWLIFESFVESPPGGYSGASAVTLGQLSWTVDAVAVYAKTTETLPSISLSADDLAPGLERATTLESEPVSVTLDHPGTPTAIDVTLTVPERPTPKNGLDPLAASAAVVHVFATGHELAVYLAGDGAAPLQGYFNGNGSVDLVAHPFGHCSSAGPCTALVRLIGTFPLPGPYGSQETTAELMWTLDLLGVPADTTFVVGQPADANANANANASGGYQPWLVVGLLAIALVGAAVLITRVILPRRRS
jgi:hypothetical protein